MSDRSDKSFVRVVMVEFYPHITDMDMHMFKSALEHLAQGANGLLRMHCGPARASGAEAALSVEAPNVTFVDFASVWEFTSQSSLDQFIDDAFHREMAKKQFSKFVKNRYVINIGLESRYSHGV